MQRHLQVGSMFQKKFKYNLVVIYNYEKQKPINKTDQKEVNLKELIQKVTISKQIQLNNKKQLNKNQSN